MKKIEQFLRSLRKYPNLFILGAGASFGLIPTTNQLETSIIHHWSKMPGYPLIQETKNETFNRIINSDSYKNCIYLSLLHNNAIDWLVSYLISADTPIKVSNQYNIFSFFPGSSFIFTFNLDNQTYYLRNQHFIIYPHGVLPNDLKRKYQNKIYNILEYPIKTPWEKDIILIKPEKAKILDNPEYQFLWRNWKYINDIIIIGYSFSRFKDDVDDYYSLLFFTEMLKYYKNDVYLLDPFPDFTQYLIEEQIGRSITVLPIKWNLFSESLFHFLRFVNIDSLYSYAKEINCLYMMMDNQP